MKEYLEGLRFKFNYDNELLLFLEKAIPCIIKYYGQEYENLVFDALNNCEIHIQNHGEIPKEYLNSYFEVDREWEMPILGGAFHHNEIELEDGVIKSKHIVYMKTMYFNQYMPFDFSDEKKLNTLVHEICHLVESYNKIRQENGKIVDYSGLIKTSYNYDDLDNIEEEKSEMVGIEEAINEVDTVSILTMITGKEQEITGYRRAGYLAEMLLEHKDIAAVIKKSQLNGDSSWIEYLGSESKKIIESFDSLVNMMYVSPSDLMDEEKMDRLYNEADQAHYYLEDFIDNYCTKEDLVAFEQAINIADMKTVEIIKEINSMKRENVGRSL